MNEVQAHMVQLLGELDEICTEHQIPYVLYGRTAKDACVTGTFCGEYMNASILIPGQYFPILEQLVQVKYAGRRGVEWVGNNPRFPGMHMRYVDEETTFMYGDSAHRYHHKGIYVSIERARQIPQGMRKAKLANWIDKVIEYAGVDDFTALDHKKQVAIRLMRLGVRCFGHERVIRTLLQFQNRLTASPSKQMAVIRYLKDNVNFSSDYFKAVKRVTFAGHSFFVPQKHGDYLNIVYGKSWKNLSPLGVSAPHLLVTSTVVSYRDLNVTIDQSGQEDITRIIQKRHSLTEQMKPLRAKIEQYWNVLFMTQCRYKLYRKYYPRKRELLLALENKKYHILLLVMQEALDAEEKWLKLGTVVSLDPEINQVIARLFAYQGKYDLVCKMEEYLNNASQIVLETDIVLNDTNKDIFWPKLISVDANGDIAVYFRDRSGNEYPVMWCVGKKLRELLHKDGNRLVPSVSQGELVALGENGFLSLQEIFTEKLDRVTYTTLMQRDFLGREFSLAMLTPTGVIYPMVELDDNLMIYPIELPKVCHVNTDLSVPTQICVHGEILGEAFWKNQNGYVTPTLALGAKGKLCIAPHYLDAELVYRDTSGMLIPIQKDWYDLNSTKVRLSQESGQPFCTLVQKDVFGRIIILAKVLDTGNLEPCGKLDETGVFQEESSAAEEYVLYVETAQQELMPLYKVRSDGGATPTVYTSFLQEVSGASVGNTDQQEKGRHRV